MQKVFVLEVFGDVVVGLGVLQALYEGLGSHLHHDGALHVLGGQRTPHDLQVLWTRGEGHLKPSVCVCVCVCVYEGSLRYLGS